MQTDFLLVEDLYHFNNIWGYTVNEWNDNTREI